MLALVALLCSVLVPTLKASDMEDISELEGVGYHIEDTHAGLLYLSLEGGAPVTIYGQMLANNIAHNFIVFNPSWIEGVSVFGPPLSDDDEFNAGNFHSNAMAGRLAYTMPSITRLMNADYALFNGGTLPNGYDKEISFIIDVQNTDDGLNVMCRNSNNCMVRYHRSYTPSLYGITPSQVCMDDYIQFHLNMKETHTATGTPADVWPFREMRIGETLVDWEFTVNIDKRLSRWGMGTLEAAVTEMSPQFSLEPNLLFYTGYQHDEPSTVTCNYAGDDCFKIRVHPKVESISHDSGFTTGGQQLTISGQGFNGTYLNVEVDGVPCTVKESSYDSITCITGVTENESVTGYQPGQWGLERRVINATNGFNWNNLNNPDTYPAMWHNVSTSFEAYENDNQLNTFGQRFSGWFRAPTTGLYRFYVSCDDQCRLYLNTATPYVAGEQLTKRPVGDMIAWRGSATSWRHYWQEPTDQNKHRSDWIQLDEGEFYHIQGDHYENTGSDHFTVSVEVKPESQLATRRRLQDTATSSEETTTQTETTTETATTDQTTTTSEDTVITEETTTTDETTTTEETTTEEFVEQEDDILDLGLIDFLENHPNVRHTVQQLAIDQDNVFEEWYLTVTNPDSGTYKLNFLNPATNAVWTSTPIPANAQPWQFRSYIWQYFNKYYASNIDVTRESFDANGVDTSVSGGAVVQYKYTIRLQKVIKGLSTNAVVVSALLSSAKIVATPPMSAVQSSGPLSGKFQISCTDGFGIEHTSSEMDYSYGDLWVEYHILNSMSFLANNVRVLTDYRYTYRENGISFQLDFFGLDYDVPLCRIYDAASSPLIGNNLNANSTYIQHYGESLFFEPIPMEMLFTDASTPQVLVRIDGLEALCPALNCGYTYTTAVPQTDTQSLVDGVLSVTGSSLTSVVDPVVWFGPVHCTISSITDTQIDCTLDELAVAGEWIVLISSDYGDVPAVITDAIRIELQVSSVSPNVDINYLGGDFLSFTGVNFGSDASAVNVTLDDGTVCVVQSVIQEELICLMNRMTDGVSSSPVITISVNGVQDSSLSFAIVPAVKETTQLEPNSVSPVLKSEIVIYLGSTYTDELNTSAFKVTVTSDKDPTYSRDLYVMSADSTANSITVKFPGAPSGLYHVQVSSNSYGRFQSDLLELNVHGTVTGISPNRGSKYGGTLVTITGENFSDDPYDNPIKIGNSYCFVQTTSATEITCRQDFEVRETGEVLVLVFLKTSEEAACEDNICLFTYDAPSTTVTDIQASFDEALLIHQVQVVGTGITEDIQLWLDGTQQTLVSFSDFEAIFHVVEMDAVSTDDILVYTDEGFPEGSEITHTIDLTPALLSISPESGNSGGTWITVIGSGFGTSTVGLNLVTSTGTEICQTVHIVEYGVMECLTLEEDIAEGTTFDFAINGVAQLSYVDASVVYTQASNIVVNSATLERSQISFAGLNFPTADFTATASINGLEASYVVITDAQNAVAYWSTTGVPAVTDAIPTLEFISTQGDYSMFAIMKGSITKELSITSTSDSLSCSFAGGCNYVIESEGLFATLLDANNRIDVCGNECVLIEELSDSVYAVCEVQTLETTYSVESYQISESAELYGTVFPENSGLYDGDHQVDFADTSAGCSFGMTFKDGHIAVLNEAKVFINSLTDKVPYVGNLVFQGSNDYWSTFDSLHTFDETLHEGWNYIQFREWDSKPAYNSYRFFGHANGACRVTEFRLNGVQAIDSTSSTHTCTPSIILGSQTLATETVFGDVTYDNAFTPVLERISPRFGSVLGGTNVTLTGTNLLGSSSSSVHFDDRECLLLSESSTQIVCTTSDKPYVPDEPRVSIYVDGMGKVATQGLVYRYVSLWSDTETWGGDIPPLEGESVAIPKGQHLLVDVDSTPKLVAIIVEGSLIFAPNDDDPNHLRTFDASYIMIQHGYMEVGTHENPYTSKLVITMHGDRFSPLLPLFGNKVIAVHHGTLDMHGVQRTHTWTRLAQTAEKGATEITLLEETDWQVGEEIVIAPTSWSNKEAETRFITAVNGSVISFEQPLEYMHFSEAPTYNGIEVAMRGEVGLLSRNVVYKGDDEVSPSDMYGCTIMLHSEGDDSSVARIEFIELKYAGQAFKLGKYPIHMHMIGNVHKSYVHGNAVHRTYNRAFTTHGVNYFKVTNNVAFDTMGHTFFIEDGVETNNVYDGNLVVQVKKSHSGLNTDQSPGGFWLTTPDNILTNNAIAGTDAYAYWYDMQETAIGPSYDPNICPEYTKLGVFSNNTAHSTKKYGLRIFHALIPHKYPCKPSPYDYDYLKKGKTDPYWQNPKIPAIFENLTAWKCGRNGAISERTGAVVFKNFKIADNGIAGMEYSIIEDINMDGLSYIDGGIVVGNSGLNDNDGILAASTVWGIIGPRYEHFSIKGTTFFNFEAADSGAIGTCSHCFHGASTDSGGRTVKTTGLIFDDATVPRRINWQYPYLEIINDLDGSLTGLGAGSWATPYYPHMMQPECQLSETVHRGVICDGTVQVRRIAFYDAKPAGMMTGMKMKVARWDDDVIQSVSADNTTLFNFEQDVNHEFFSRMAFRPRMNPMASWPIPFVTNHRYRVHWGENLDFESVRIEVSTTWQESDHPLKLMTNFTDTRVLFNLTYAKGKTIENGTYNLPQLNWESGSNVAYNDTKTRQFNWLIMGKDIRFRQKLFIQAYRCIIDCEENQIIKEEEISDKVMYWSKVASWPSGTLPIDGDEVQIEPSWNMVLDIDTPLLEKLIINGRLTFLNDVENPRNLTLHAKRIYVRAGELLIGSEEQPYVGNATIKLYGLPNDETLTFNQAIEGGNKVLAIVGLAKMYGQPRDTMSRLKSTVFKNEKSITVSQGLDWVAGDQIALLPSATQSNHIDYNTLVSYNRDTGVAELENPLKHYHWGKSTSTGAKYEGLDMRTEVVMLSRNVRIIGDDTDTWGGQVVVSDSLEFETMTQRTGQLILDFVEVYNCSQRNTFHSAIRFEMAKTLPQLITNSAIHQSQGWSLLSLMSSHIHVEGTHMIGSRAIGVNIQGSHNVTLKDNIVSGVGIRPEFSGQKLVDKMACFSICVFNGDDTCTDIRLLGNIAAGCPFAGFVVPGHDCGQSATQESFRDNVAHSIDGTGAHIVPDVKRGHTECYEGSHFSAYKCQENGIAIYYATAEMRMSHMKMVDNTLGVLLANVGEKTKIETHFTDSHIWGESPELSEDCPPNHPCICQSKAGQWSFGSTHEGKSYHITGKSLLPVWRTLSYGAWASKTNIQNIVYEDFDYEFTRCGSPQSVFALNPSYSDYIPLQNIDGVEFVNVADNAVAFIMDPNPGWANPKDCVLFPCTAPSNVIFSFKNARFSGQIKPSFSHSSFQIISDTPGASDKVQNCEFKEVWNAWVCTNKKLAILNFIADDEDWEDKNASPVYVSSDKTGFINKVNIQMDHMWDGFYTGQKHKSQLTSFVESDQNYTIEYTGTPYKNMRYQMHGGEGQMKLRILYWDAGSYAVYVNNKKIDYTPWDQGAGKPSELSGYRGCGENRYVGVDNFLEFIITPGCTITVKPVDSIMSTVRMDWTLDEFYSQGGVTSFADRVASALGIHASRIKIVAVYKGSVVVDYHIEADVSEQGTEEATTSLRRLERNLQTLITSDSSNVFGAPVLSASTGGDVIIDDPNYTGPTSSIVSITKQLTAAEVEAPPEKEANINTIVNNTDVTIEEEVTLLSQETKTMLWILGMIVLVLFCCIGCGATILCYLRFKAAKSIANAAKRPKAAERTDKVMGESSAMSDAEVREQYNPEDIDIFATSKQRCKFNEDDFATEKKMIPEVQADVTQNHDRSSILQSQEINGLISAVTLAREREKRKL